MKKRIEDRQAQVKRKREDRLKQEEALHLEKLSQKEARIEAMKMLKEVKDLSESSTVELIRDSHLKERRQKELSVKKEEELLEIEMNKIRAELQKKREQEALELKKFVFCWPKVCEEYDVSIEG